MEEVSGEINCQKVRGIARFWDRVLRGYMHMRLAKLINGPDTTDYILRPDEVMREGPRPKWGDHKAQLEEILDRKLD